ncbi:MAG: CotH kinase family protein [Anaerolineaceae bacterium]|nr:CotH kinase family protein [Anaerolineaceae bacterium]
MLKKSLYLLVILTTVLAMSGCSSLTQPDSQATSSSTDTEGTADTVNRPKVRTDATHGDDVDPDYDTVFPQDEVNRIDITISADNWDAMLADMTELYGEFGESTGMMGFANAPQDGAQGNPPGDRPNPGDGQNIPQDLPEAGQMPDRGANAGGGLPAGNMSADSTNPIWVTATISFEGSTWDYVGIRFKGNSSLKSAWSSGNLKLPFKLDFDQFEEDYPEIDDQRFYGFKQLSLASNFNDDSYLREKVTADIFRDFGVPSAHTAFYEVYVDYGEGPVYFGLYTMVEMVEDTVISQQFESDEGNLYKPEGTGATFAEGTFNEASFDKETNQDADDYSDIEALFAVLHDETRLTNPASWRSELESVLDVDTFLRWLAVNTVVQNWDTYGNMSHNYFLYTDPEDGLITWIPWDNNHALDGSGKNSALSLSLDEVTDKWPLISYLMDDPTYQAQYDSYVEAVVNTVFVPDEMAGTYQYYHDLIAASTLAETAEATMLRSQAAFENSVPELVKQVNSRYEAVQNYLSN